MAADPSQSEVLEQLESDPASPPWSSWWWIGSAAYVVTLRISTYVVADRSDATVCHHTSSTSWKCCESKAIAWLHLTSLHLLQDVRTYSVPAVRIRSMTLDRLLPCRFIVDHDIEGYPQISGAKAFIMSCVKQGKARLEEGECGSSLHPGLQTDRPFTIANVARLWHVAESRPLSEFFRSAAATTRPSHPIESSTLQNNTKFVVLQRSPDTNLELACKARFSPRQRPDCECGMLWG
ncbi:hypothetical protein EDD37DRAFT_219987 [Exophiala viscosa]|uniref:uncharacterized protein n=1 Tax=Exophiala viscosa TaxID=2486360 RepID=UPI00218D8259|nr:hypothetical protein EDD37DRAFT_219987 [Exophiala viscosa]